jgi:predicted RNase H-like HicB family nuclease
MADYKYQMIITWSEEDQRYIVDVPELPGCMADGITVAEAVENANVVIAEWIEFAKEDGIPVPIPKGVRINNIPQ